MFVQLSDNRKIGKVSTTYAPIKQSCPSSCALKDKVCYAQTSYTGIHNARLEKKHLKLTPEKIARIEARGIDNSFNGGQVKDKRPLRLHTAGDARTNKAASILGRAAKRWLERKGGPIWTYTHAWRIVRRSSWGKAVSVLASIDRPEDAHKARKKGYAPAIVVDDFPNGKKSFQIGKYKTKFIACPNQTIGITCDKCKLCFDDRRLKKMNMGIAFRAHGSRKKSLKLKVIQ